MTVDHACLAPAGGSILTWHQFNIGRWCSTVSMAVSKTAGQGSNPCRPASSWRSKRAGARHGPENRWCPRAWGSAPHSSSSPIMAVIGDGGRCSWRINQARSWPCLENRWALCAPGRHRCPLPGFYGSESRTAPAPARKAGGAVKGMVIDTPRFRHFQYKNKFIVVN